VPKRRSFGGQATQRKAKEDRLNAAFDLARTLRRAHAAEGVRFLPTCEAAERRFRAVRAAGFGTALTALTFIAADRRRKREGAAA